MSTPLMPPGTPVDPARPPRLLEALRAQVRYRHYSIRTEEVYVRWVRSFVRFHELRHPSDLAQPEIEAFLTWLATEKNVSPSTHRQALSALLFLYQKVLNTPVPWMQEIGRPQATRRLPVVLSQDEVLRVLAVLDEMQRAAPAGAPAYSAHGLFGRLLYGTGLRLMEALRLRVKDIDFEQRAIVVREGKGAHDRLVMLPEALEGPLRAHLALTHTACGRPTAAPVPRRCRCRMRWSASTRAPACRGRGSGSSRRPQPSQDPRGAGERRHHSARPDLPACLPPRAGASGRGEQAGVAAHAAPFLRHPPAAGRLRHPHRAGTAGPCRRQHHHDLHARAAPGRWRRAQPAGQPGSGRTATAHVCAFRATFAPPCVATYPHTFTAARA